MFHGASNHVQIMNSSFSWKIVFTFLVLKLFQRKINAFNSPLFWCWYNPSFMLFSVQFQDQNKVIFLLHLLLTFCLNCIPPHWYLKLLKNAGPSDHSTVLLWASEILIRLQVANLFPGAFLHSPKQKIPTAFKHSKSEMRKMRSDALLWNGNICERDPAQILAYGWPFFFAWAQLHVLPSPNQGICSCFVIPHLSQLCNASSSPCQPIAIRMEMTGKYKADGLGFVIFSSIFNICAAFSIQIIIYCKAYCLHCVTFRNAVHWFVIIIP